MLYSHLSLGVQLVNPYVVFTEELMNTIWVTGVWDSISESLLLRLCHPEAASVSSLLAFLPEEAKPVKQGVTEVVEGTAED